MYPAGEAIAEAIETTSHHIHVNICASNGSYTNIQMLSDGQIDLGLVSGDAAMRPFMELTNFQLTLRQDFPNYRSCLFQYFQLDGSELFFLVLCA